MGLFSRLRPSSNTTQHDVESSSRPTTPTPNSLSPVTPLRPSIDQLRRPSASRFPPSISPTSSKFSIKPWKKTSVRWPGTQRDEVIAGPAYEGGGSLPKTEPAKRDTVVFIGRPSESLPVSPASTWGTNDASQHTTDVVKGKWRSKRKDMVTSGEFKQEGGIIGRLAFESVFAPKSREASWLDASSSGGGHVVVEDKDEVKDEGVMVDRDEGVGALEENGIGRSSEEVEVLESEKKQRFWKGKGRTRTASKADSDVENDIPPGSPTSRKATLPPASTETPPTPKPPLELHHPRPQNPRRPSASLFNNPFVRSLSRASLRNDLERRGTSDDEGSFQLRAFRHVSGASEGDFTGPQGYFAHAPRESIASVDHGIPNVSTPEIAGSPNGPPTSFPNAMAKVKSPGNAIAQPPSVAGSVDDIVTNSNKISAAAFRKGRRRPSEGPATTSECGGNLTADEDDDLPLEMIRKTRTRDQSTVSLTSLWDKTDDSGPVKSISRPTSPGPNVAMHRHERNGQGSTSSFVVKGARSSRVDEWPVTVLSDRRRMFVSPVGDREEIVQEIVESPKAVETNDPMASINPFPPYAKVSKTIDARNETKLHSIPVVTSTSEKPADTAMSSPTRQPPPVEPIDLPEPEDIALSVKNLPLPPDLMPDTPPKKDKELPDDTPKVESVPTSPKKGRKMSILEEPLKLISGLWTGSSAPEGKLDDDLDIAFVVNSMEILGDGPDEPRTPSRATLFDAMSLSSDQSRSPLRTRLESAASALSITAPHKFSGTSLGDQAEVIKGTSGDKDSGMINRAPAKSTITSSFTRDSAMLRRRGSKSHSRGKAAWSSSESDGDSDDDKQKTSPNKPGRPAAPNGPRKPSDAPRTRVVSDVSAVLRKDDSSSEDESLAALRAKSSKSSLSINKLSGSPNVVPSGLPASSSRSAMTIDNDRASISSFRPPTIQHRSSRPPAPPIPARSPEHPTRPLMSMARSTASSSRLPETATMPKTAGRVLSIRKAEVKRTTASPESSQSGRTNESFTPHPTTPSDSTSRLRRRSMADGMGQSRSSWDKHAKSQVEYESPRSQSQVDWHPQQMGSSQVPTFPSGTDPHAMMTMMKQAWQAQFMAAAYRASEDEWERASAVSGATNQPSSPPVTYPPPMPMAYGMPPMGYPFPSIPNGFASQPMGGMPWMYPHPNLPQLHGGGGGMYTYGPNPQTVFGGDFGPPSQIRRQDFRPSPSHPSQSHHPPIQQTGHVSLFSSTSTAPSIHGGLEAGYEADQSMSSIITRPGRERSRSSMSPSQGVRWQSTLRDGQWDDPPTPGKGRRSSSQWAN